MELKPNIDKLFINGDALNIVLSIPLLAQLQTPRNQFSKPLGRPRKTSGDDVALIEKLLKSGIKPDAIADSFGVSRSTAYRIKKMLSGNSEAVA